MWWIAMYLSSFFEPNVVWAHNKGLSFESMDKTSLALHIIMLRLEDCVVIGPMLFGPDQ